MKHFITACLITFFASSSSGDTFLSARNAHTLCTTAATQWVDFCNGLIQGYADYAVLTGNACIPSGTTRTTMITIYTDRLPGSQAYKNNEPALMAAVEILSRAYSCR